MMNETEKDLPLRHDLARMRAHEPRLGDVDAMLDAAAIQLDEATLLLGQVRDDLDIDPEQLETLEQRLGRLHELARKHRVTPEELARAKAQLVARQTYKLDSMFAQAMEIGQLEAVGIPYRQANRLIEKLQAVSADQVGAVARQYFRDDQLTVGELDPQPLPKSPRTPAALPRH